MTRDRKILYVLAAAVTAGLLPIVLFVRSGGRVLAAAWLTLLAAAICLLVKKRRALSVNRKMVLLLTATFMLLYLTVFYLSGLYFGFVKTAVPFNFKSLITYILPILLILSASEIIRRVLLMQESTVASALAFLCCLLADLTVIGGLRNIRTFSILMDTISLTLLPAVTTGILCQFVSARHGALPPIVYRAMLTLAPYLIPVTPAIPNALTAFITLLLPLVLLLFLRTLYEKRQKRATVSPHAKRLGYISAGIGILLGAGLILLISCQFRFGTVVIATGSMTGELNVGDAIIYERYDDQIITEGTIVVFEKDRSLIVHRVVEIERINGQNRYYTKGDANEDIDLGYITDSNIKGITNFKVSYIGYPSLWLHRIFENRT
ncbi:MAG: signal peptidase I [Clostridia bacterium]|nr:signal peptidase I [Clostridia bacterium]